MLTYIIQANKSSEKTCFHEYENADAVKKLYSNDIFDYLICQFSTEYHFHNICFS